MDDKAFQREIHEKVKKDIAPIFTGFDMDISWLEASMKWKPLVLVIGGYSSGKSTLINELLGMEVQRTGQAPTDDSFTVITNEGSSLPEEIPGSTLLNDYRLPFTGLKSYGQSLISHFCLKNVPSSLLEDSAIIDTPGMMDSTTERDRGYRYLDVIGDLSGMADMIIMMFDPHKAGTIRENFSVIRNILPERAGEDRVVFVLSRIDECDNVSDLIRSYGSLCWNISQMTGRKDMPHIYLTYSPKEARLQEHHAGWPQEREELKNKISGSQSMRVNHILENVDRKTAELEMVCESMYRFSAKTRKLLANTFKWTLLAALVLFLASFGLISAYFPNQTEGILPDSLLSIELILPAVLAMLAIISGWFWFSVFRFKRLLDQALHNPESIISLDNDYRRNIWSRVRNHVLELLRKRSLRKHLLQSRGSLNKVRRFIREDMRKYYSRMGQKTEKMET